MRSSEGAEGQRLNGPHCWVRASLAPEARVLCLWSQPGPEDRAGAKHVGLRGQCCLPGCHHLSWDVSEFPVSYPRVWSPRELRGIWARSPGHHVVRVLGSLHRAPHARKCRTQGGFGNLSCLPHILPCETWSSRTPVLSHGLLGRNARVLERAVVTVCEDSAPLFPRCESLESTSQPWLLSAMLLAVGSCVPVGFICKPQFP